MFGKFTCSTESPNDAEWCKPKESPPIEPRSWLNFYEFLFPLGTLARDA
jgi:hypothetical protein